MIYTVHQAKTHLSRLISQAERGEEVVIARGDKPAVRLTSVAPAVSDRGYGIWKDRFRLTEAFFEPLPDDELALWNGEGD